MQDYQQFRFSKLQQLLYNGPLPGGCAVADVAFDIIFSLSEKRFINFKLIYIPSEFPQAPRELQRQLPFTNQQRNPEFVTLTITTMGNPPM